MPRPVARDRFENMHEPETETGPLLCNQGSSPRKQPLQIAPMCPQERKNRCSEHVGPKIQNKSPRVLQCPGGSGGGAVSRSMVSSANFSPSPFLGACVTTCDTLPREHGCRGNVCTCYTFVTCYVSDTLFPGWVFLAQVWAGVRFSAPTPTTVLSKPDHGCPRGERAFWGRPATSPQRTGPPHSKAQAQAELVL